MITSMVSAMGGPISLIVSGWLGGSGTWLEWPWNWFPLQQICSEAIFPKALPSMQGMVCLYIILSLVFGNDCQARIRWQNLGLQFVWVQTGVLGRKRLGPWAMLLGQIQGPNGSRYLGAIHVKFQI